MHFKGEMVSFSPRRGYQVYIKDEFGSIKCQCCQSFICKMSASQELSKASGWNHFEIYFYLKSVRSAKFGGFSQLLQKPVILSLIWKREKSQKWRNGSLPENVTRWDDRMKWNWNRNVLWHKLFVFFISEARMKTFLDVCLSFKPVSRRCHGSSWLTAEYSRC